MTNLDHMTRSRSQAHMAALAFAVYGMDDLTLVGHMLTVVESITSRELDREGDGQTVAL